MTEQTDHRSYQPGYGQVSHHEWRTAENSAAYLLPVLQEQVALKPQLKLLDIGAGSGTITASLSKYMSSGQITAVDLSDEILDKAKRYALKADAGNIVFKKGSVFTLVETFGEHSFDIVHTSMMLCHLDDPVAALKQMLRVCKPGGIVAARESDLRMMDFYPETPGIKAWHNLMLKTHLKTGGSIEGGARLLSWAMHAGVKREQATIAMGTWCYATPQERRMWSDALISRLTNGVWRSEALADGIATEQDIEEMIKDLKTWAETEDACFGSMHGELIVRV
ncbi:hypothetical protein AMS68_002162 [Peltaster fructicola]|uniref:Methyltransferase type 11 domain-containing protein n=1 Tax=Peltaster fructicola TaxID=286661 RepID=A0A6H0XPT8_9PEZI|nr:hypothetical protein AMS68_002162 [Peltaster fructicola]